MTPSQTINHARRSALDTIGNFRVDPYTVYHNGDNLMEALGTLAATDHLLFQIELHEDKRITAADLIARADLEAAGLVAKGTRLNANSSAMANLLDRATAAAYNRLWHGTGIPTTEPLRAMFVAIAAEET